MKISERSPLDGATPVGRIISYALGTEIAVGADEPQGRRLTPKGVQAGGGC